MNHYKNILVCLDLTEIDKSLIRYTSFINQAFHAEKITFFHVVQTYDLSNDEMSDYAELGKSIKEAIRNELDQEFDKKHPKKTKIKLEIKYEEQDASEVILDYIRRKDIDITILGKKPGEERKGFYSNRIIAASQCDILMVPKSVKPEINTVLSLIDFSKQSREAFRIAIDVARECQAQLISHYIFSLPRNYFPISYEGDKEQTEYLKKEGKKKQARFLKNFGKPSIPVSYSFETNTYNNQIETIEHQLKECNANLIVLGARGKVSSPATLLGNISGELHHLKSDAGIIIVKNKTEKHSFWNIFLNT